MSPISLISRILPLRSPRAQWLLTALGTQLSHHKRPTGRPCSVRWALEFFICVFLLYGVYFLIFDSCQHSTQGWANVGLQA